MAKSGKAESPKKRPDDRSKTDLINRKVAPRLRMFANCDEEVCLARAENECALAVTDDARREAMPLLRTGLHAPVIAAREKRDRGSLRKPINSAKASVFIQFSDDGDKATAPGLREDAPKRQSIVTAELPLDEIAAIARQKNVVNIEAGDMLRVPPITLSNDAEAVREPGRTERKVGSQAALHKYGEDVLVGIIDVGGIAFAHEDFLDDKGGTRIHRIWDMGGEERKSPSGFDYGAEFKREDLNAAIKTAKKIGVSPYAIERQRHMQRSSHATHVASIAAGNRGVCRKATIACVMIDLAEEDLDRRKSFYDSTRVAHALEYLIGLADELGRERGLGGPAPLTVNISLGTNGHAHDGSSAVSRWIDHALSMPGRAVAVAAGNSGQEAPSEPGDLGFVMGRIHTSGQIAARGLTNSVDWIVVGDGIADISENEMEIWYEPQDRFSVTVTSPGPGSQKIGPVPPGKFIENRQLEDGSFISIYNELYRPANGANTISIYLTPRLKEPLIGVKAGAWRVSITGDDVRDGRYHAWIERDDPRPHIRRGGVVYASYPSFFSQRSNVDKYSVSSLACGERILAVGNYDEETRRANISSSQGPTRIERMKPEILAPGTDIVAANGFASPDEPWIKMTGTSMASPYAAGVAGLMLAAERAADASSSLTAAQIIGIMRRTAHPVDDNDYSWKDDIGFGLIDADACVDEAVHVKLGKKDDLT